MNNQDIRTRLEAQYQGTAAYLSQVEKMDPKDLKVTDRSKLLPADETSCVKVSDAKKEGQLGTLDSKMKSGLQPTAEELAEMKKRQQDPKTIEELRRLDTQIALMAREDAEYKPYVPNQEVIQEGPKKVKALFDDILSGLE